MAQEPLVESDIKAGRDFVRALERKHVPIDGAFWLFMSEIERWKLVIVSPRASEGAHALYSLALDQSRDFDLSRVQFMAPDAPISRALRNVRMHAGQDTRVSHSMLGGIYVDEAFVYRLAA